MADSSASLVISIHREWPWGLAMWTDAEATDPLPDAFDDAGVAAAQTAIVAGILHAVDGPATAQLWLGEPPDTLLCIHDAPLELPSGRIALGDAVMEDKQEATLPIGSYRARLCVDATEHPGLVALYLMANGLHASRTAVRRRIPPRRS